MDIEKEAKKVYEKGMKEISAKLNSKMKALGFSTPEEVQYEIELGRLKRSSMGTNSIISEIYEHNGIEVLHVLWSPLGITYLEQKDEKDIIRSREV